MKLQQIVESLIPKTGVPFEFEFMRNTTSAGNFGSLYGQHIEPHGRYMLMRTAENGDLLPGWESGRVRFNKPLVIHWGNGGYADPDNWKQVLFTKYQKKGKALSKAIRKDGFDGIITFDRYGTKEIVDLTGI